jgi:hypothetical protein
MIRMATGLFVATLAALAVCYSTDLAAQQKFLNVVNGIQVKGGDGDVVTSIENFRTTLFQYDEHGAKKHRYRISYDFRNQSTGGSANLIVELKRTGNRRVATLSLPVPRRTCRGREVREGLIEISGLQFQVIRRVSVHPSDLKGAVRAC